jgi:uncharacterized protein (DUF1800 family)
MWVMMRAIAQRLIGMKNICGCAYGTLIGTMNAKTISRNTSLERIDPKIAWEAWEPSDDEPWTPQRASLLIRRAGFAATEQELRSALSMKPDEILSSMMGQAPSAMAQTESFESDSGELAKSVLAASDMKQLAAWWLYRMLHSPAPLIEKMTLFWHGHFATGGEKVLDVELMHTQNQLLRKNAVGDFQELVQGIAKDPAMLIYLDSVSNRKARANENFARELMELFCLGEGNYTEADVQQLAKCFTGWEIRRKQFRFNPYQHDDSKKMLLGNGDVESGENAVECVLASPHMPRFIVRKLFRFFVSDEGAPTDEFLAPLANRFTESKFSIEEVVRMILSSRLLLSEWSVGRKIRSPIELVIGWMRTMQCTTNMSFLAERLRGLGQSIFFPPNVKGWEGGRAWINSSTLVGRANLIYELIQQENTRFDGSTLASFVEKNQVKDSVKFLTWFESQFFAEPLTKNEREQLAQLLSQAKPDEQAKATLIHLASLPRIHLT